MLGALTLGPLPPESARCDASPPCKCAANDPTCMCPMIMQMGTWQNGICVPWSVPLTPPWQGLPLQQGCPPGQNYVECFAPGPGCGCVPTTTTPGNVPPGTPAVSCFRLFGDNESCVGPIGALTGLLGIAVVLVMSWSK